MSFFYKTLLLLLLSLLASSQDASPNSIEALQAALDQFLTESKEAKAQFEESKGELSPIQIALNENNLANYDQVYKKMQADLKEMQKEKALLANATQAIVNEKNVSQEIQDILNQKTHVLFDDSESEDPVDVPQDDQNEILIAQVFIKAFFGFL